MGGDPVGGGTYPLIFMVEGTLMAMFPAHSQQNMLPYALAIPQFNFKIKYWQSATTELMYGHAPGSRRGSVLLCIAPSSAVA